VPSHVIKDGQTDTEHATIPGARRAAPPHAARPLGSSGRRRWAQALGAHCAVLPSGAGFRRTRAARRWQRQTDVHRFGELACLARSDRRAQAGPLIPGGSCGSSAPASGCIGRLRPGAVTQKKAQCPPKSPSQANERLSRFLLPMLQISPDEVGAHQAGCREPGGHRKAQY